MSWEVLIRAFFDCNFPREKREAKVEEFINLCQGGMTVQEYSLKFTKFYKYAPSLVSNPRDEISPFVTGVYNDFVEEFCSTMIHDNMDISWLMLMHTKLWKLNLRGRIESSRGPPLMREVLPRVG